MASVLMHPRALAEALDNAVAVGKDKPGVTSNQFVAVMVAGDKLLTYGRGRYLAGRHTVQLPKDAGSARAVLLEDVAAELASALKKVEGVGRKDTQVAVTFDGGLAVMASGEPLCDLEDEDPAGGARHLWDTIDHALLQANQAQPCDGIMFSKEMMQKISKIKGDADVVDLVRIGGSTMAFRIGTTFQGVAESIDRASHASGGRYGDGTGTPANLWGIPGAP